jgi:acetoin utilization deacetylase AcuC-like enzyme
VSDLVDILKILTGKRFPFKFVYTNEYWMFDPGRHVFPIKKYRLIYESLLEIGARPEHFIEPRPASDEELLLVHTPRFLKKIETSSLNRNELQELELRFSPELVRFSRLMVGGTILTLEQALSDGLAVHIGGGFHHAFPDHGEGFCLLNDVAVAVESAVRSGRAKKVMIIDCDLHQGNGTAAVFAGREDVFTFSIHQMDIYPSTKPAGTLDVGLWSGDGDEKYLAELGAHVPRIYEEFRPDLVVYLAGADPFEGDQLGGLFLTKAGLKARDKLVLEGARSRRIPVAVLLAGGYAADIRDTVDIHLNTIRAARVNQRIYS